MLGACWFFLISFFINLRFVRGDVALYGPKKDSVYEPDANGKVTISLQWYDNGAYPTADKFSSFVFTLNYGPNNAIQSIKTLTSAIPASDISLSDATYSYDVSFDSSITGNGQYFIQVYGIVKGEGATIHYSPRFKLTNMTNAATTYTYSYTVQPQPQTSIVTATTSQATIDTKSFTLNYTQQTGVSRFAPMQTPPGPSVTATTWTMRFPTSAVTYYATFRPSLDQVTTITQGWSGSFTSDYNYATPAAFPSDNGGGYDPASRITLSARKVNYRRV